MCLHVFAFVEPGSKNVKSDNSYVRQFDLFRAGFFYWGFLFVCKTMQILKVA